MENKAMETMINITREEYREKLAHVLRDISSEKDMPGEAIFITSLTGIMVGRKLEEMLFDKAEDSE